MAKENANSPIEVVEFRATAPKQALPGLDDALVKLRQLKTELDLVNGLLSGTSTHSAFKQTAKEMEQFLKSSPLTKSSKRLTPSQVAQALGVPDEKDFNVFLNRFKANNKDLAKTMFKGDEFASAGKAAELVRKYFLGAEREMAERISRLQALFNQGIIPKGGGQRTEVGGQRPTAGPRTTGQPTTGPKPPGGGTGPTETHGRDARATTGKSKEEDELVVAGKAFRERLAAIARDMEEEITSLKAGPIVPRPDQIGRVRGNAAGHIRLAVSDAVAEGLEEESVPVQNALAKAAKLEADQEKGRQARMAADLKATGEARAALAKAQASGDKAAEQAARRELDNLEQDRAARQRMEQQQYKARNRMTAAGAKSQAQADKQAELAAAAAQQTLYAQVTGMGARQAEAFLQQRGATLHSYKYNQMTGAYSGARYTYDEPMIGGSGYRHTFDINYGAEKGSAVTSTSRKLSEPEMHKTRLDRAVENLSPQGMAANILTVAQWAAAVGVLYKAWDLAKYSLERLVMTGMESAHLGVVFRGVGGDAQALTNDIIRLAAEQGRETSEAMESATAWARLGGDRKTINEEVRVSAVAANIANMHMGETTKQLMSLMHIYHLEAGDLNGTLGMLVNTSLKYNVTLEELFTGLDRSAAAAKVAGMGLGELQAMIGVVVGATGTSGSATGNAIKYVLQELNKSGVQRQLRGRGIEALGDNLEQKPAGQILADLSGKWGSWGQRERQAVSGQLGGRFNAARVPVIIEDYPKILRLAIDGQLNLNKAQEANVQILETVKAQLMGVRSEWDRLVVNSNAGPFFADMARTGKNVLHWANENLTRQEMGTEQQEAAARNRELARQMRERNPLKQLGNSSLDWLKTIGYWTGAELWGTPYSRHLLREQPGVMDYFNYTQEPGDFGRGEFLGNVKQQMGNADVSAKRARAFGIGLTQLKNGSMTADNANDYALIMQKMGGGLALAAQFTTAFDSHDTRGAIGTLTMAQQQAKMEETAQKKATKDAADTRLADLTGQAKKLGDESDAAHKAGQIFDPAKQKQLDDLHQAMELATADANDATGAYEELEGQIENVAISLEKYVTILKTLDEQHKAFEKLFTQVPAFTQTGALAQQQAILQAQMDATQAAHDALERSPDDKTTDRSNTLTALQDQIVKLQAELNAARSPANLALAAQFDEQEHGIRGARNLATANDYGVSTADKLLRQRGVLSAALSRDAATPDTSGYGRGRALEEEHLLLENGIALAQRRAEVEKEINQLYYDRSREFRKNTLGGGPEQLLRTLAAFRTAFNDQGGLRNISAGQMLSMGPEFRQAVTGAQAFGITQGKQLPQGSMFFDPQMMELLQEQSLQTATGLAQPGLGSFASGGYTGSGNPSEIAGVVHKGEYVLSQEDLFNLHHDNLVPKGARLAPGGGVYRPAGIPLEHFGQMRIPTQESWLPAWSPGDAARQQSAALLRDAATERGMPAWSPGRGTTTAPWSPRGTSFSEAASNAGRAAENTMSHGWTPNLGLAAARGFLSDPKTWVGMGANLAHGAVGFGVTSGLNWAGGKINPKLKNSDTYGGATFGLFSDAAGGAVAGARGGPLGMGIGAVSGMVLGDAGRIYGNLRDIHRATVGDDKTHQQVDAAQQAMLRRQRDRAEAPSAPPVSRGGGPRPGQQAADDASAQRSDTAMAAADAQMNRWDDLKQPPKKPKPIDKFINPATGQPWGQSDGERRRAHPDAAGSGYWNQAEPRPDNGTNGTRGAMPPPPTMPAPTGPGYGGGHQTAATGGGEVNGCLEISCRLLGEFNTGLTNATAALAKFVAGLSAPPRGAGGAPSVPQGGGMGGAAGYRGG